MSLANPARPIGSILALALCVSLAGHAGPLAAPPDPTKTAEIPSGLSLRYVDISPSVTMLQNDKGGGANITCVALDEGLVFVDASLFTELAARFRSDMETKFAKKTVALLLTHGHVDHFFGMGAFADVPVFAAAAGREMFRQQLSIDFAKNVEGFKRIFPRFDEAVKTGRPFMPTIWMDAEIQIGAGEKRLAFRNTGGHSVCSSYAHLPSEGVLVVGDHVQVDAYPYFGDATTDIKTWIETLRGWETFGDVKACPGHGRVVDRAYVASVRAYFEDLVAALAKLKAGGTSAEEAVGHPTLPRGYWGSEAQETPAFRFSIARLYASIANP